MYANRISDPWIRLRHVLRVLLTLLGSGVPQQLLGVMGHSAPYIGPGVPQMTLLYRPLLHITLNKQAGLPAPQGTDFEGPDPGLNPAIISAPEVCPNNYMRDVVGRCRPSFSYGPNPLSTFSPEKFKGSIQVYMGLQVGRHSPVGRRRHLSRPRNGSRRGNRLLLPTSTTPAQPAASSTAPPLLDEETPLPELASLLPTPPPLTGPVAEITAILESLHNNDPSSADTQPIDDDDD